jgi:hypothetical protein
VKTHEQKRSILCNAPALVEQRLAEHDCKHRRVHGIAIDAIQPASRRLVSSEKSARASPVPSRKAPHARGSRSPPAPCQTADNLPE